MMTPVQTLPLRQVHLDFHTAPLIPDVGIDFDPAAFVQTLQAGHINSVTVFSMCHHGWCYYPTQVGTPHPHLRRADLFGEMVRACKAAGIRVCGYTTVTWNELAWEQHPEWRAVGADGRYIGVSQTPLKPGWKNLCMNSGYADYLIAHISEVLKNYPVDGLFIDIVKYLFGSCVCDTCRREMLTRGLNPEDAAQRERFGLDAERRFMARCTAAVRTLRPDVSIFYNSRLTVEADADLGNRPELDNFTHIEIESLPGGYWGYDHFPLYVRYFQQLDRPLLAMTGRFHTAWGDFGGLRNRAALEFEAFQALAHGAAISIGDQLHPRGALEPAVYQRIGEVYAEVERREGWVMGTTPLPEIGLLSASGGPGEPAHHIADADIGAVHILEQLKHQFSVLDSASDFSPYALLVLPDAVRLTPALADRLRAYVATGGALLISGESGLDAAAGDYLLADIMGAHYDGSAAYAPDYLILKDESLAVGIEPMPHAAELQGVRLRLTDAAALAVSGAPYFNRTWQHFCSHQYTPLDHETEAPVIAQHGRVITLARPLFTEYAQSARRVHKQIIANCISRLLPHPLIGSHSLPSTAIVTARRRGSDLLLFVLHYVHQRRGSQLDVIEDVLPLHDVHLSVRAAQPPSAVQLLPEKQPAVWSWDSGYVRVQLPRVDGLQMVLLEGVLK